MKTNGKEVTGVYEDVLVIPRGSEQLVFKGRAIRDYTTFNALCPPPKAPKISKPTGDEADITNPGYLAQMDNWSKQKFGWIVNETLYDTEFETVDPEKPMTWNNWLTECNDAGLSDAEQTALVNFVLSLNTLTSSALEAARSDFLRSIPESSPTE